MYQFTNKNGKILILISFSLFFVFSLYLFYLTEFPVKQKVEIWKYAAIATMGIPAALIYYLKLYD